MSATKFELPKSLISKVDPDSLKIPPKPFRAAIDCSSAGNWRSPDKQVIYCSPRKESDKHLGIMPLRLNYFFESEEEKADLLFVPVAGSAVGDDFSQIPYGLLSVVQLRRNASSTGSLDSFEKWFNRLTITTGRHPATWIWWSWFENKTGKDENGNPTSWHRLQWVPSEIDSERPYKMLIQIGKRKESDPEFELLPQTKPAAIAAGEEIEEEEV